MRHHHIIGIAAVAVDAERIRLDGAHVLVTCETGFAFAAAEPGIGQRDVSDLEIALVASLHLWPKRDHLADGLMPHRSRQRNATILQRERLAPMAEIVATFPDMQIAMTDAGRLHLDQNLRSRRLGGRSIDFLQRSIELSDLETLHCFSPDI